MLNSVYVCMTSKVGRPKLILKLICSILYHIHAHASPVTAFFAWSILAHNLSIPKLIKRFLQLAKIVIIVSCLVMLVSVHLLVLLVEWMVVVVE